MSTPKVPEEAASAASLAIRGTWTLFETCPELAREVVDAALAAAFPHLLCSCHVISDVDDYCPQHGRLA